MKIWCYDDAHYWGASLMDAANKRGHDAKMFDNISGPDEGVVFMHMHAHPAVRKHHKGLMQHFATNPQFHLIPDYRATMLYDDKVEQLRQLSKYMPQTRLFRSPAMAREYLETQPALPIISKSCVGAGVRYLRNADDARREIKLAFSDLGVKNKFGDKHHGYLYWQNNIGDAPYAVRVIGIGDQRILVKRPRSANRLDPFDHKLHAITELNEETLGAIEAADRIFEAEHFNFAGLDMMQGEDKKWHLLKMTVGWHVRKLFNCKFFPDNRAGTDFWDVLVDQIEARLM
jgi:glutathione synthase/RimK-type ligase-like ATP-grasp enzyme